MVIRFPRRFVLLTLLIAVVALGPPTVAGAADLRATVELLLPQLGRTRPPGDVLFAETFEAGLDHWRADAGWGVRPRPGSAGKCAAGAASSAEHEDLILKERIAIVPGHPVAIFWRARFLAGSDPLYLRVDYYDESGKQGKPYARQQQSRETRDWTDNVLLASDGFPEYTRSIRLHFHHAPGTGTTSLLADVRVVDLYREATARANAETANCVATARRLQSDVARLRTTPVSMNWKRWLGNGLRQAEEALSECSRLDPGDPAFEGAFRPPAAYVRRASDAVAALREGFINATGILVYRTTPISGTKILPDAAEIPGWPAHTVEVAACPGQFEPVSLVLWHPEPVLGVALKPGPLTGPAGTLPASCVDVKWVKCWYQAGTAWTGVAQDLARKVLVPELLVNDDFLVKVDRRKQHNLLKLSFPGGARWVPIDDPTPVRWGKHFPLSEFPVRDAPHLLPTDLPAGENKQVWVTVHVPHGARPGEYRGEIALLAGGKQIGAVRLYVRVLPFGLGPITTHYDAKKAFTGSLYYWGELDPTGAGGIGYKLKSEQQFRAELRTLFDHGIVAPAMVWSPEVIYYNEHLFRRHLAIAREVGMSGRPLYLADSGLIGNPTKPEELETLRFDVRRAVRIAREYGFTGVYFYGLDEAAGDHLRSQRPAWEAVHEAGGKVFVSGFTGQLEAVGDLLDLFNHAGSPEAERPAEWHKGGHRIWNYSNPQTPVENPELYRRNYGLLLWKLDYDGACTYCFMDSSGTQWNDFDDETYRDHCLAYPTVDGVVGTLALEGFRAGMDDLRYVTVLRAVIERALRGGSARAKARARQMQKWLESADPRRADLDALRQVVIERILELERLDNAR